MTQREEAAQQVASTRCPFLVEETAQCCRLAPFSKLVPGRDIAQQIVLLDGCLAVLRVGAAAERAARGSGRHDATGRRAERPVSLSRREVVTSSCAAAPSNKLIPRTVLAVRRCLGDSHRYCEFFLERACPRAPVERRGPAAPPDWLPFGAGRIPIAPGVALAPNHMWLDVGSDGSCHVGVDAFMVRVLGAVDEVTFLSTFGPGSPSVVLTVAGTTLPLVFPQPLDITGANSALRRHLDSLTADPYRRGWLYEGRTLGPRGRIGAEDQTPGLRRGADAETWMASEVSRVLRQVRTMVSRRSSHLGPVLADGGEIAAALAPHLDRAELLEIFSLFFSGGSG